MTITREMSVQQCADAAKKDPLPELSADDLAYHRERFVKDNARRFSLLLTGETTMASIRRLWKYRQHEIRDSYRWDAWLARNNAKYDTHRGCYIVTTPEPAAAA